jgi:hypothetical protein
MMENEFISLKLKRSLPTACQHMVFAQHVGAQCPLSQNQSQSVRAMGRSAHTRAVGPWPLQPTP